MVTEYKTSIFLCHTNEDKPAVRNLYQLLLKKGLRPWLDEENLLPGHDWHEEVKKVIDDSMVVLVCLSNKSVTKAGYIQKEVKYAIEVAEEYPLGEIFLIPVRLEMCIIPRQLEKYQWVDLFEEKGFDKLLRILRFKVIFGYGGISSISQYAEELYLSAGYEDLKAEIRNEMIRDITERVNNFILAKSIAALSDKDALTLEMMINQNASDEKIQEFLSEKILNLSDFLSPILLEFRAIYLGLSR
jgi:hypothetical protein